MSVRSASLEWMNCHVRLPERVKPFRYSNPDYGALAVNHGVLRKYMNASATDLYKPNLL